jgi:hypothetical protein
MRGKKKKKDPSGEEIPDDPFSRDKGSIIIIITIIITPLDGVGLRLKTGVCARLTLQFFFPSSPSAVHRCLTLSLAGHWSVIFLFTASFISSA